MLSHLGTVRLLFSWNALTSPSDSFFISFQTQKMDGGGNSIKTFNTDNTQMKVQLFKQLKFYDLPKNRLFWSWEIIYVEELKIIAKEIPSVDIITMFLFLSKISSFKLQNYANLNLLCE